MTSASNTALRRNRTICMHICQAQYSIIIQNTVQFQIILHMVIKDDPDIFPPAIAFGHKIWIASRQRPKDHSHREFEGFPNGVKIRKMKFQMSFQLKSRSSGIIFHNFPKPIIFLALIERATWLTGWCSGWIVIYSVPSILTALWNLQISAYEPGHLSRILPHSIHGQ